jgi:hypothetical protein
MNDESHPQRITWIPWILALVALLGFNAISRDDSLARRSDTVDEAALTFSGKSLETTGRASSPLVLVPPAALSDTLSPNPAAKFVKLDFPADVTPSSWRRGVAQGRAPPVAA